MKKRVKQFLVPIIILLLGIIVSGCAALVIGGTVGAVGGYEYRKGQEKEKKRNASQSNDTTYRSVDTTRSK